MRSANRPAGQTLFGVDFTSRPTARKPIVVACCRWQDQQLQLEALQRYATQASFESLLSNTSDWVGGFDMPFALPRSFLREAAWPHSAAPGKSAWQVHVEHLSSQSRADMVSAFKRYTDARPAGQKFAHRACDIPAGSSPSMKWVNPPVAFMLHAGAPSLLRCQASLPGMHEARCDRIALEAYPGFAARAVLVRQSYKSDDKAKQDDQRRAARACLLDTLLTDNRHPHGLPTLQATSALQKAMIDDASGDSLDAVLCALQAAWGAQRADQNFGLPPQMDPLEGWIVSVPFEQRAPASDANQ